jgi:hypothetical protein
VILCSRLSTKACQEGGQRTSAGLPFVYAIPRLHHMSCSWLQAVRHCCAVPLHSVWPLRLCCLPQVVRNIKAMHGLLITCSPVVAPQSCCNRSIQQLLGDHGNVSLKCRGIRAAVANFDAPQHQLRWQQQFYLQLQGSSASGRVYAS